MAKFGGSAAARGWEKDGDGRRMERTLDGGVGGVGEDGAAEDAHYVADAHGDGRLG
jgi:hypothetical protein